MISRLPATPLVASSSAAAAASDRVANHRWPATPRRPRRVAWLRRWPAAAPAAANDSVATSPVVSNSAASSSSGITSLVAAAAQIADGCARLQCLARCCSCGGGDRAHRALEDTVAIRNVMGHFAAASGLSTKSLLTPFARRFDVDATLLARSFLC